MAPKEWTKEEVRYLRENYRDTSLADMGFHLHVAPSTVRNKLILMGLDTDNSRRVRRMWTKDELEYLRENYPTMTAIDIADHIGCSNTTVSNKAKELGLKKSPEFRRTDFHRRYVASYRWKKDHTVIYI